MQSRHALLHVSGRVRHEDLRVETAAELALQSRSQVSEGRALNVFQARLLQLVFLDHDQAAGPLAQRVQFNARFVMDRGDCPSKAAMTSARCKRTGKALTTTATLMSGASSGRASSLPWWGRSHLAPQSSIR